MATTMLATTTEAQYDQRLCERALLNEGFDISPAIQKGIVTAMAQVVLDAGTYDARRRTQAALTLAKFQQMRVAELHDRERFRLQEMSLDRQNGQAIVQVNNVNQVDVRAAVAELRKDQAYVDYVRNLALERDADAAYDGSFSESREVEDVPTFDRNR